jgi:Putative zinc-finger
VQAPEQDCREKKGRSVSRACAAWRGDIGAYIVGALSPQAGAQVKRHLQACPACKADYQDLVPVRDLLDRAATVDGIADGQVSARPPLEPLRRRGSRTRRHWPAAAVVGAAAAAVAIAVITARPVAPVFHAFDRASGAHGQAQLRATPSGTQISLTISGLPPDQRCILIALSPAGTDVAATWNTAYTGTAHIEGTSAIPVNQITALEVESPAHRFLLRIPV